MTVGNRTYDFTVQVLTDSGKGRVGTKYSRIWSGGDSQSLERLSENNYTVTYSYESDGIIHYSTRGRPTRILSGTTMNTFGGISNRPSLFTSNDKIAQINKLLGKVRGHSFNMGISVAEGKETVGMIHESMQCVLGAYLSLRRGNVKKTVSIFAKGTSKRRFRVRPSAVRELYSSKSFADKWLGIRYGWIPFLSDAYEAAQFLSTKLEKSDSEAQSIRTGKRLFASGRQTAPLDSPNIMWSQESRLQHIAKFRINQSFYKTLTELGLVDPLSVAWEVLPYSFVADWFIPVGSYLEARGQAPLLEKSVVVVSEFNRVFGKGISSSSQNNSTSYVINDGGDQFSASYTSFKRTISSSITVPLPEFRNPLAGTWKHFVDSFALLRNRVHS